MPPGFFLCQGECVRPSILRDTEAGFLLWHKTSLPFTPNSAPMLPKKQECHSGLPVPE